MPSPHTIANPSIKVAPFSLICAGALPVLYQIGMNIIPWLKFVFPLEEMMRRDASYEMAIALHKGDRTDALTVIPSIYLTDDI